MVWIIKNWKIVAVVLLAFGLVFSGYKLYRAGADNAATKAKLEFAYQTAEFWRTETLKFSGALQKHSERTQSDTVRITELNKRIASLNEYADTLQDRDLECLSGPDVDRVRDLWEDPGSNTGSPSPAPR